MKKIGTLNAQLSYVIASMGHTDRLVVTDCGLPLAHHKEVVDLALTQNIPGFIETLKVILEELKVERAIIAEEMEQINPKIYKQVTGLLTGVPIEKVTHRELKGLTNGNGNENIAFVRTGEATPYANIILISGVTFD
jgi:D-ribose pyranase